MPDGRFVNKSISVNERLGRVSPLAAILFTWCIPHLDRDGRMAGGVAQIRGAALPLRADVTDEVIPNLIRELGDLVRWYEIDGKKVLELPGFLDEQRGGQSWYNREAQSRFPPHSREARDLRTSYSR